MPASFRPFNTWDAVKIIGLLIMVIDHTGAFIFTDQQWLRAIGRGAPPIFLFLAGYAASYRFQKDLLGTAILLLAANLVLTGHFELNILFTIIFARLILDWLERRGKIIKRPFEWYVGSVAAVATIFLTQYGSIGFLFALCGYLKRRRAYYTTKQRFWFWVLSFTAYGIIEAVIAGYSWQNFLLMAVCLGATSQLLYHLDVKPITMSTKWQPALTAAHYAARYSAYVYALHLIFLVWATGISY